MNRLFLVLAVLSLSACSTTYTRAETKRFTSQAAGKIPLSAIPTFADCVLDGFQTAHPLTIMNVRQQRRSNGFRVESFAGMGSGMVMMSADILDDGHVELWESDAAALINTKGERDVFAACLRKAA